MTSPNRPSSAHVLSAIMNQNCQPKWGINSQRNSHSEVNSSTRGREHVPLASQAGCREHGQYGLSGSSQNRQGAWRSRVRTRSEARELQGLSMDLSSRLVPMSCGGYRSLPQTRCLEAIHVRCPRALQVRSRKPRCRHSYVSSGVSRGKI